MSATTSAGFPDQLRQSHGLEQFFSSLGGESGMSVLDLGEFTQANVSYITGMGHRLYFEDVLHSLDAVFGTGHTEQAQSDAGKIEQFLEQVLQFPAGRFDAILVWDTLEHLTSPLLAAIIRRLHTILRSRGVLLACFHAEPKGNVIQTFSFRISDSRTLLLHPKGRLRTAQSFNNRAIERLFEGFSSVKFFLTRDYIREVIVHK